MLKIGQFKHFWSFLEFLGRPLDFSWVQNEHVMVLLKYVFVPIGLRERPWLLHPGLGFLEFRGIYIIILNLINILSSLSFPWVGDSQLTYHSLRFVFAFTDFLIREVIHIIYVYDYWSNISFLELRSSMETEEVHRTIRFRWVKGDQADRKLFFRAVYSKKIIIIMIMWWTESIDYKNS